jgi:hypothetical protein
MSPVLPPFLDALVDYAGLFPPAQLGMDEAVGRHAAYRTGPDQALLGRFIVPVARLDEFEAAHARLTGPARAGWRLSGIVGADPTADSERLRACHGRQPEIRVVSVEGKADTPAGIEALSRAFPESTEVWVELPAASPALPELLAAVRAAGRGAKLRTGGVTADAFPSAVTVARFLRACRDRGVVLKATAGLHHPLRGEFPLTYAPDAPLGRMFGFLNLFIAAALTHAGAAEPEVVAALEESRASALVLDRDAVRWRAHRLDAARLETTRRDLFRSFGSCSFTEPVEGLRALSWF